MPVLCMPWLLWKSMGGGLSMACHQTLHSATTGRVLQGDNVHSLNLFVVCMLWKPILQWCYIILFLCSESRFSWLTDFTRS